MTTLTTVLERMTSVDGPGATLTQAFVMTLLAYVVATVQLMLTWTASVTT